MTKAQIDQSRQCHLTSEGQTRPLTTNSKCLRINSLWFCQTNYLDFEVIFNSKGFFFSLLTIKYIWDIRSTYLDNDVIFRIWIVLPWSYSLKHQILMECGTRLWNCTAFSTQSCIRIPQVRFKLSKKCLM